MVISGKCPQFLEVDTELCRGEITEYLGFVLKYFGKNVDDAGMAKYYKQLNLSNRYMQVCHISPFILGCV